MLPGIAFLLQIIHQFMLWMPTMVYPTQMFRVFFKCRLDQVASLN